MSQFNPPQNLEDFNSRYEALTPRQKEVLFPFLAGKTDQEIAEILFCTKANVRYHLSQTFRAFGLSNSKGDRCRNELVDLFISFKPDLVSDETRKKAGYLPKEAKTANEVSKTSSLAPFSAAIDAPRTPGGAIALNSPFYIQPGFAERCYEEIMAPGQLIRIRAAQMTGKTSLLYRILNHAETEGYHTLNLNLHSDLDEADLGSLATFLQWFCREVAERLELPLDELPTTKPACSKYFQTQVLAELQMPLVIALDEAEVLFEYPAIAREFFGLLRSWHEKSKAPIVGKTWEKLRLVVVHSTDDYIGLSVSASPFKNVGYVERLKPLQADQIYALAQQYGLPWSMTEVNQLMALVGGHPFLVQQALYSLWRKETPFSELLANAATLAGIYRAHLQNLAARLRSTAEQPNRANLSEALAQVIRSLQEARLSEEQLFKLEGLGLVQLRPDQIQISCELYRQFFRDRL